MFELLVLFLCLAGFFFLLRGSIFSLVFGIILLGNAINIAIFGLSKPTLNAYPFYASDGTIPTFVADPLAQALILTAIVISFSIFFYMVSVTIKLAKAFRVSTFDDILDEGFDESK